MSKLEQFTAVLHDAEGVPHDRVDVMTSVDLDRWTDTNAERMGQDQDELFDQGLSWGALRRLALDFGLQTLVKNERGKIFELPPWELSLGRRGMEVKQCIDPEDPTGGIMKRLKHCDPDVLVYNGLVTLFHIAQVTEGVLYIPTDRPVKKVTPRVQNYWAKPEDIHYQFDSPPPM